MKKKIVLGVIFVILFVFQGENVFAQNRYNDEFIQELERNNLRNIERLLERRSNQMDLHLLMYITIINKRVNEHNRLESLRLLVRYGADVNRVLWRDRTLILEEAVNRNSSMQVIQFLLESGANPNLSTYLSPLYRAYSANNVTLVNLMLDRNGNGTDILQLAGARGDNDMIRQLISRGMQLRSEQGAEALMWAAFRGRFDTVRLLVENGVNINARNNKSVFRTHNIFCVKRKISHNGTLSP